MNKITSDKRKAIPFIATLLAFLVLIILHFGFDFPPNKQQAATIGSIPTDIDVTANITTNTTKTILKNTFGLQTRGFFEDMMYDRQNPIFKSTKILQPPEAKLMQNVYSLKMNSYRYPGGTFARYSHPSTATTLRKGYGINPDNVGVAGAPVGSDQQQFGKDWFSAGNPYSYVSNYQNYVPFSFTDSMIQVAKNTGPSRSVIVVANLVYGEPAETIQLIQDFIDDGVAVVGVEMGNEHYAELPAEAGIGMTSTDYLAKSKFFATAIKNVFPQIKIGIVASTAYPNNDNSSRDLHYLDWNNKMAFAITNEMYNNTNKHLYDAYVTHIYKPIKCNPTAYVSETNPIQKAVQFESLENCVVFKEDGLVKAATTSIANQGTAWGAINTLTLTETFKYYSDIFGLQTPVWVTEWGMAEDVGGVGDYPGGVYGNTLIIAQYMQDFLNFVNTYNSNPSHPNVITSMYYHTLSGGDVSSTVLSEKYTDKGETFVDSQDSKYNRRLPWYTLKMMSQIYNTSTTVSNISVSLNTSVPPSVSKYLSFNSYLDVTNNNVYVYFSNRSGVTAKIPNIVVDGIPYTNNDTSSAEIVSGDSVLSGSGYNFFDNSGTQLPIIHNVITNSDARNIVISGYSYGYIKFTKPVAVVDTVPTTPILTETHTSTSITLSSNNSTDDHGVAGYDIYRKVQPATTFSLLTSTTGPTLSYVDNSVSAGNTYVYKIKAKDTIGQQSLFSNTVNVKINTIPLGVTLSVPNQNNLQGTVILSATTVGTYPKTKVEFYIGTTLLATAPTETTPNVYTFPWSTLSVSNGTKSLKAKVYDSNGGVVTSAILSVIVNNPDITAPTKPTLNETHTNSTVTLTSNNSTDNVGVVSYDIYKDSVFLINKIGATLNYTDTTVSPNNSYTYYIQAKDQAGNKSIKSDDKTVIIPAIIFLPPVVSITSPTATTILGNSTITATASDADGTIANVEFNFSGPTNVAPTIDNLSPYSFVWDTTTALNGSYTIVATATDSQSLTSSDTITVLVDNPDIENPSAPEIIENHTNQSVTLSWVASTDNIGIDSYEVYNAATNALINSITANISDVTLSSTYNNLIPDSIYSFYVVAKDLSGNKSANSNIVSITTDPVPTPTDLLGYVNDDKIDLTWTGDISVAEYQVFLNNILIGTTTDTNYEFSPAVPGTTYSFFLKAKDSANYLSLPTNTIQFTIPIITTSTGVKNNNTNSSGFLKTVCNDKYDNDGDGFTDYPNDKGCTSALSNTELPYSGIIAKPIPPVVAVVNPKVAGVMVNGVKVEKEIVKTTTQVVAPIQKAIDIIKNKLVVKDSDESVSKTFNFIGQHPIMLLWLFLLIVLLLIYFYKLNRDK